MRGVNATRRVVLHLKSVTEHASLRESQTARDLERNGNSARHHPVQVCIEGGVGGFQVCIEGRGETGDITILSLFVWCWQLINLQWKLQWKFVYVLGTANKHTYRKTHQLPDRQTDILFMFTTRTDQTIDTVFKFPLRLKLFSRSINSIRDAELVYEGSISLMIFSVFRAKTSLHRQSGYTLWL